MSEPTLDLERLTGAVRELALAMRVMETRHPHCGAVAYARQVLHALPPALRPADIDLPAHAEDDADDGRATIRDLMRENAKLRAELAEYRAEPTLFEIAGGVR